MTIDVLDEPGVGGANCQYLIHGGLAVPTHLIFQNGPFACEANKVALTYLETAQHYLQQRTKERMERGVEGTHVV